MNNTGIQLVLVCAVFLGLYFAWNSKKGNAILSGGIVVAIVIAIIVALAFIQRTYVHFLFY